jgi:hypothetical protein
MRSNLLFYNDKILNVFPSVKFRLHLVQIITFFLIKFTSYW